MCSDPHSITLNFKLLLLISNKGNYESCSLDGCLNNVCLIVSFIVNVYQSGTTESFLYVCTELEY